MGLPWLRILDAVIGVTDLARSRRIRQMNPMSPTNPTGPMSDVQQLEAGSRSPGGLEARLAGVVVAALKEAFDRDTRRIEIEREQLEAERQRAERALRLELLRQAGEREMGRLRLIAGVAAASWIGTLFFATRLVGGAAAARVALGGGWLLLLAGIAASFAAQSNLARELQRAADDQIGHRDTALSGAAGALAPWSVVAGLALVGVAALIA